jgi:predicted secreted protein
MIRFAWLCCALLLAAPAAAQESPDFDQALQRALRDAGLPLDLDITCSESDGRRALRLFPSGVFTWNGERQARVDAETRQALLQVLAAADFAAFEERYGGKPIGEAGAPILVLCRIAATVDGVTKSSVQDANGERSQRFMALAKTLLDLAEPLGAAGVAAASFGDGLEKLASGVLAPEALDLQLLHIPSDGAETGAILGVSGGVLSRRAYRPGVEVGTEAGRRLAEEDLRRLLAALRAADLPAMPPRLPAPDVYRLQIQVLQHLYRVEARPAGEAAPPAPGSESERLVRLAEALLELR